MFEFFMLSSVQISVAEPHQFDADPASGKVFPTAPALALPQYVVS
jgi:hypothetical protein